MRNWWRLGLAVLLAGCGGRSHDGTAEVGAAAGATGDSSGALGPLSGAAGDSPGRMESAGGTGGDFAGTTEPNAGTGGEMPMEVEPLTIPATPFLIEGFDDLNNTGTSTVGPWLMTLHASPEGGLDGAIVSLDYTSYPREVLPDAAALHLEGVGVTYHLSEDDEVTLKTYQYASERVSGICLANKSYELNHFRRVSEFTFFDDTGDGVADRLLLSGQLVTQGDVSADYDDHCGYEGIPIKTPGRIVNEPLALHARGNALYPTVQLENGFLTAGSASLQLASGATVAAEPLVQGGLIYGFTAPVTLEPGSHVLWQVEGTDTTEQEVAPLELAHDVESWPTLADGGFENLALGTRFEDDDGRVGPEDDKYDVSLAIAGARSLILDGAPDRQRFRVSRSPTDTVLRLLAWGPVRVEAGALGGAAAELAPLLDEGADCLDYPEFCARAPVGSLRQLTYALPAGDADVLVQLYNDANDYGAAPESLWIDELRAAPPPPPRLTIPALAFRIEAIADPSGACNRPGPCLAGPWLLGLHTAADGKLDGVLAALDGSPEQAISLEPAGKRYRAVSQTPLKYLDWTQSGIPDLCLGSNRWQSHPSAAYLEFEDADDDGIADHVALSGTVSGPGETSRFGSYGCGNETYEIASSGAVLDQPPTLELTGDALSPSVRVVGLLTEGTASLIDESGNSLPVAAQTGFISSFSTRTSLAPGSAATWQITGHDALGRAVTPNVLPFNVEAWPLTDGTFESAAPQMLEGDAKVQTSCMNCLQPSGGPELPALVGNRSLELRNAGSSQRFRFARSHGESTLHFVAVFLGLPSAHTPELLVSSPSTNPYNVSPAVKTAECQQYPAVCALLPPNQLQDYSVPLPAGNDDVLLRVTLRIESEDDGSSPVVLWLDDFRLE